jgi:hypothetical protein
VCCFPGLRGYRDGVTWASRKSLNDSKMSSCIGKKMRCIVNVAAVIQVVGSSMLVVRFSVERESWCDGTVRTFVGHW